MNILDNILRYKKKEVAERKENFPLPLLERSEYFESPVLSLKESLKDLEKSGIIAEFKRKSPSRGLINEKADVARTTKGYCLAGASALSVLTDQHFFGGSNTDLSLARKYNACPILRKDFMVDEYQVVEARSIGADAILLIASILSKQDIHKLSQLAQELQMEVLLEIHDPEELGKLSLNVDIIGVNNRNLKDFTTSHERSLEIADSLPKGFTTISESGIYEPDIAVCLKDKGYDGFLIGEQFMKYAEPWKACGKFIEGYKMKCSVI